ncbi:serine hydrolase domain-containing protein [Saccharicrinis sp. FJH54]|uniref:serine hydrolase domain-containing protein n=1 Tax=Saccharicrinis sp. FJH54 TaxID=3344665 RepID=UPI0035D431D5
MRYLNITTVAFLLSGFITAKDYVKIQHKTEKLFKKELKKEDVQNAFLHVYSDSHNIDWFFADGMFKNGEAVSTANPFYTASIGKTFTATAIAKLVEEGKLNFTDKIYNYLPEHITTGLHVMNGTDYSRDITIAQLLQHTSGLPDYFEGVTTDGSPNVMELMFADTAKYWSPEVTIQFIKEKMEPGFIPGNGYSYTDTEYNLLGMIIEHNSGMPLADYFKKEFFTPLKMYHTYMYHRSEPLQETPYMSEVYVSGFEAGHMTSLTADWAGGGIVSTSEDLRIFIKALFDGELVSRQTLERMQRWIPETKGMYYGFGLRKIDFRELFPTLPKLTVIGHSGSTGSFMYYCPKLDTYITGTLNQTDQVRNSVVFMVKVLGLLSGELKN